MLRTSSPFPLFLNWEQEKITPFVYWSDRKKRPPPDEALFHFRSFSSNLQASFQADQKKLPPPQSYRVLRRTYTPTWEEWSKNVEKALRSIENKELEKVVLGRLCILECSEILDPFAITASLFQRSEGAFLFCLGVGSEGFLGATPERLFRRDQSSLTSEALAGTCPRGKTPEEDLRLQKNLLQSPKDLREIRPVQRYLQERLDPICFTSSPMTPLSVHQTQTVQHLYSRYSGVFKEPLKDSETLSLLHPTPALSGSPQEKAMSLIQEVEPFDRGLFGGVVGWSTEKKSEWLVAIRSCLVRENTAVLFSGAGIVEGSSAEKEWEELSQKIRIYDRIFVD